MKQLITALLFTIVSTGIYAQDDKPTIYQGNPKTNTGFRGGVVVDSTIKFLSYIGDSVVLLLDNHGDAFTVPKDYYASRTWVQQNAPLFSNCRAADTTTEPVADIYCYTATQTGVYDNFIDYQGTPLDVTTLDSGEVKFVSDGATWSKVVVTVNLTNYYTKSEIDPSKKRAEGAIDEVFTPSYNILEGDIRYGKLWNSTSGADVTLPNWVSTIKMKCLPSTTYNISGYGSRSDIIIYDNAGAFILNDPGTAVLGGKKFTTPENADSFAFDLSNTSETGFENTFQLSYGEVVLPYLPPDTILTTYEIKETSLPNYYNKEQVDSITDLNVVTYTKNKFNPSAVINGYVESSSNNGWTPNAAWRSAVIPVDENTTYTISGWNSARTEVAFYSGDVPEVGGFPDGFNLIVSGSSGAAGFGIKSAGVLTLTAPANATYYVMTIRNNVETDAVFSMLQFEEGATKTSYEPYDPLLIIDSLQSKPIAASYISVGGNLLPSDNIQLKGEFTDNSASMILKLDTIADAPSSVIYSFEGHAIEQTFAASRSLTIDASNVFDFRNTYVDSVLVHSMNDIAAPYRMMATTIGANHGYLKTRITRTSHGKTNEDVGSVWTDGTKEFIIINIVNANALDVSARLDNSAYTGPSLTHVSGATHTATISGQTSLVNSQFYPCFKNRRIKAQVDGQDIPWQSDDWKANSTISFIESYDIMSKASIMEWLITQVGTSSKITQFDGSAVVTVSMAYVFNKTGGCTIYTDFLALDNVSAFADIMFNMSSELVTSGFLEYYIPKSLPFTQESVDYDFTNLTDMTSFSPASRVQFTPERCEPTGIYCDRALMFNDKVGFAVGYLPLRDASIADRRTNAPNKALEISTAKKVYLSAIDGLQSTLSEGDYFSVVAYKQYFFASPGETAHYTVQSTDGDYSYFDWHTDGIKRIDLPVGKSYTLIEKSPNVTIMSNETTGSIVVNVDNSQSYGYLILKSVSE